MEQEILELQQKIEILTTMNTELKAHQQEYLSAKQSLNRMSVRLRKLCKRLTPLDETVIEMQKIAEEIRKLVKKATSDKKENIDLAS